MLKGRFGQLAGFHLDIGAHGGVGVTVLGNDVICAGIEAHDGVRFNVFHNQPAFAIRTGVGGIDREFQLVGGNLLVGPCNGVQHETTGIENQHLFLDAAGGRHVELLGDTCAAESDVDEIFARHQMEFRRAAL